MATVGRDPSPTFHLPVVYLVNCPGFLIGLEVERTGTITGGITFAHGLAQRGIWNQKALKLSSRERARLAQCLISSLDQEVDGDAEKLRVEEAERRLDELKSDKVAGIPADKVIKRARSALR